MPIPLIGAAIGVAGAIGKMFGRGKANRELKALLAQNPTYKRSEFPGRQLGIAQQLFGGRMAGATQAERNIFANQASTAANVQRNATDAATALSYLTGLQGQTNEAIGDLGIAESQNKQQMLSNLNRAYQAMQEEDRFKYGQDVDTFERKLAMRGAMQQNKQANWGDISNLGFGIGSFGLQGGFDFLNMPQRSQAGRGRFSSQPITALPTIRR